jgi:hypothetical protein
MAAASSAALAAPGSPMASVPTGTPFGICTMESSASTPFNAVAGMGTPSTGRMVLADTMPGRCAAPPAAAMMTSSPRPSALAAYSNIQSGVRCADTIRTSCGTSSSVSSSAARDMIFRSLRLPMIMPTRGEFGMTRFEKYFSPAGR